VLIQGFARKFDWLGL